MFKIVSLVPSQTELLVDLGLEDNLVGITKFCEFPVHLKKTKTIVGGTKTVHFDRIKNLKPDFILCNKEENTKEIVFECEKIAKTHVSNIITVQDTFELIKTYGNLFSKKQKALALIEIIEKNLANFNHFLENKPNLKVAYFIWRKPWMVAANNTFINHMLQLNKFSNAYENKARYPEINLENLKNQRLDLILLSSEPYPFNEKHIIELKKNAPNTKIIFVDGAYFSWYGSRLVSAFNYFKSLRETIEINS